MYLSSRDKDIKEILKYHRAKDMINIMKYFPGLSPVEDLAVVTSKDDYLKNADELKDLTSIRNGNSTSELCMKSIPVKEINPDILEVMDEVKKENKNGVVILFRLGIEPSERYDILRHDKFLEFNLSGHTEGKRFRPWQIVDDKRM